jgi:copper(I)-binding protein
MRILFLAPVLLALATTALADSAGPIHIADAKARPTAPGAETAAVYLVLMNHGAVDDSLTAISTPVADKAELHRTVDNGGMSEMDAVPDFTIKANGGVSFEPGGLHIMLMGLKQQLKIGDSFPLTLTFAKAGAVTVTASVQAIKAKPKPKTDMPGMKM